MLASTFSFLGGWILLAHSLSRHQAPHLQRLLLLHCAGYCSYSIADFGAASGSGCATANSSVQQNPFTIVAQPQQQIQTMPVFTTSGS